MKILIIGSLGVGKSTLAYSINKKFGIPRLNLDEICRNAQDGSYYSRETQQQKLQNFLQQNDSWVAEGCQKYLYEKLDPDLIIDMRINRLVNIWRFTWRFFKAKKLLGKEIDPDLPIQAYHYRKISLKKIREYDLIGLEINAEIREFLRNNPTPSIQCKSYNDYPKVFAAITNIK